MILCQNEEPPSLLASPGFRMSSLFYLLRADPKTTSPCRLPVLLGMFVFMSSQSQHNYHLSIMGDPFARTAVFSFCLDPFHLVGVIERLEIGRFQFRVALPVGKKLEDISVSEQMFQCASN